MVTKRYYIDNYGEQIEPINLVFDHVIKNNTMTYKYIVISEEVIKENLTSMGFIESPDKIFIESENYSIKIITKRDFSKILFPYCVMISLWLNSDELFEIEEKLGVSSVYAIPWLENSLEKWCNTYGPIIVNTGIEMNKLSVKGENLRTELENYCQRITNWSQVSQEVVDIIKKKIKMYPEEVDSNEIFSYLKGSLGMSYHRCLKIEQYASSIMKKSNDNI